MSFLTRMFDGLMEKNDDMVEQRRASYKEYRPNGFYTRNSERSAVRSANRTSNLVFDEEYVLGVHSWAGATKLYQAYKAETERRKAAGESVLE